MIKPQECKIIDFELYAVFQTCHIPFMCVRLSCKNKNSELYDKKISL